MKDKFATADDYIAYVAAQIKERPAKGHDVPRLTSLANLLYHSYFLKFSDSLETSETKPLHKERIALTEELGTLLGRDLKKRAVSNSSLIFLISYPRSGVTLLTNLCVMAAPCQQYAAMKGALPWFSKESCPGYSPVVRLVKDHCMRPEYEKDDKLVTIRDGRDSLISLAYMTLQKSVHNFSRKEQLSDFIKWTDSDYRFGSWIDYVRNIKKYMRSEKDILVRYEELVKDHKEFYRVLQGIPEMQHLDEKEASRIYGRAGEIKDRISKSAANKGWGFGRVIKDEDMSLFAEWSKNRGSSSWQSVWTKPAGEVFHEMGGTDLLIEMGYETDQDWWKQL